MSLSKLVLVRRRSLPVGEVLMRSIYACMVSFWVLDKTVVDICEARAHIPGGHIDLISSRCTIVCYTIHRRLAASCFFVYVVVCCVQVS